MIRLLFVINTRSLLRVFEEDTAAVSDYCTQLYRAMQRIYDAQNELSAATHLTSRLLKEYDKQRFPLGGDDEVMSSTLQQFAKVIDEVRKDTGTEAHCQLSSCQAVLSTQLADAMMFPVTQFKERDLKEILTLKEVFQISSHAACFVPRSRRGREQIQSAVQEERQRQGTSRGRGGRLHLPQEAAPDHDALLLLAQHAAIQEEDGPAGAPAGIHAGPVRRGWSPPAGSASTSSPRGEPDSAGPRRGGREPAHRPGQLLRHGRRLRRPALLLPGHVLRWQEVSPSGGVSPRFRPSPVCLLPAFRQDGDAAVGEQEGLRGGGTLLSLVCQLLSVAHTPPLLLPSQWIATINNISKRIYLSENAEELAARVNQSALEAVTPSPSFQQRHESLRPGRWVSRGSGLRGQGSGGVARASSISSAGSEPSPALSVLSLDALVAPDTPIQFDIISPVSEEHPGQNKTTAPSGRRSNPFGEAGDEAEDDEGSILHQLFIVRFLGCMEVKTAESADVISETMRQILAARAIHNIFRMDRVTPAGHMRLPQFPLASVLQCSSHQDNKRLFGFVLQAAAAQGDTRAVCYIFESNNEGEKICDSVGLAKQIAFHSEMVSPFSLHHVTMTRFHRSVFVCVCVCVCVGPEGRGKEEGAGKSQREASGRAQQAEADREGSGGAEPPDRRFQPLLHPARVLMDSSWCLAAANQRTAMLQRRGRRGRTSPRPDGRSSPPLRDERISAALGKKGRRNTNVRGVSMGSFLCIVFIPRTNVWERKVLLFFYTTSANVD
ncbi:unnamed protein product [Tetraodon nigroviridis]|uniref:(spotted green pufferfish) hypothetical protein n=1 Tax=Tetraodon nigroviridis TaxID=99883 RepID=Q4ST67_TETNG|nr:unnamed protein product [Tetraodon nigroviridis]